MTSTTVQSDASTNPDPGSLFKILVATDIHLGYGEKNPILADDSFNTFEEILQIALSREVDFILLGGDLFHDPTPSANSLNRCIKLLRTYVLGDKMIEFEFKSDQSRNFPESFGLCVNYEDMNLNVSIPVFSIHGNHDDITGTGRLSSMDVLSTTGLINYFGKWRDLSEVEINPIILTKNDTNLALYGLSHIHDNRLARLFRDHKVNVRMPTMPYSDYFSLMVLHQNRADRGRYNYLPEDRLPGFLDFVVWGHEHDCRIDPEQNPKTGTHISQPGSSVATSLSEGESITKKIGILEIYHKNFKLEPIKLKTVRPFVFESINIDDFVEDLRLNEGDTRTKVTNFYTQNIEEMIVKATEKLTRHEKQPTLPLIRLRIIYSLETHVINTARFGQSFDQRIANPESALVFKKLVKRSKTANAYNPDEAALQSAFAKKEKQDCVEDVVESYFNEIEDEKDQLKLFSLKSLTEVCRLLVDKDDDVAAGNILQSHFDNCVSFLSENMCNEEDIPAKIEEFRQLRSKAVLEEALVKNSTTFTRTNMSGSRSAMQISDDDDDEGDSFKQPTATKGRGRGRGASSKPVSRAKNTSVSSNDSSNAGAPAKRGRAAAVKQLTLPQSTQRSQRASAASKSKASIYVDDSDSD